MESGEWQGPVGQDWVMWTGDVSPTWTERLRRWGDHDGGRTLRLCQAVRWTGSPLSGSNFFRGGAVEPSDWASPHFESAGKKKKVGLPEKGTRHSIVTIQLIF